MSHPQLPLQRRVELVGDLGPIVVSGSYRDELIRRDRHSNSDLPVDVFNLSDPVIVEKIAHEFMLAGAELIISNTTKSNRHILQKFGLANKVYEINRKGVWIARTAAMGKAWVAGVIGPLDNFLEPLGDITPTRAFEIFSEQASGLIDGGADVVLLKSFIDVIELEIAIDAVRSIRSDLLIIASKTFPEDAAILSTSFPQEVAKKLRDKNVLAFGSNGTVGPQRMLGIIQSLRSDNFPLLAMPDIGIPTMVDGKNHYNAEPEYLGRISKKLVESGAVFIGADGGATIDHVQAISTAVKSTSVGSAVISIKSTKRAQAVSTSGDFRSSFSKKLFAGEKVTTVELDVPRGLDMHSVIEGARFLKENGVTAVNISDGARARLRMSPIALSQIVQSQTDMECITHLSCRDRNMVGLQSELLGAWSLGVKNILAVTGDPTSIGDYPYATTVVDIDAVGLVRSISNMNRGCDLLSGPLGEETQFTVCCACNPGAFDLDKEITRLTGKSSAGAQVVFSQPVFDFSSLQIFLEKISTLNLKFIVGVIPLRSLRHAEFLHYEVPGMGIPAWVRDRMGKWQDDAESSSKEGIEMATELLEKALPYVDGIYLMPPFKKYEMATSIIKELGL